MTHVYPLMKEKFASIEHISFFVELTTVALDTSRPEFQSIFTFLCLDEKVNPRFVFPFESLKLITLFFFFFQMWLIILKFQVEFEILVAAVGNEAVSCQSFVFARQLSINPFTKLVPVILRNNWIAAEYFIFLNLLFLCKRISFLLPSVEELEDDFDRLNSIVRRLPRMAELTVQSNIQFNCKEMILEFMMMISANLQNIQVTWSLTWITQKCQ